MHIFGIVACLAGGRLKKKIFDQKYFHYINAESLTISTLLQNGDNPTVPLQ